MITRVTGKRGELLHDCAETNCDVSWDGFALRDLTPKQLHADDTTRSASLAAVAKGERVPNGGDPDVSVWAVNGKVAKLKS